MIKTSLNRGWTIQKEGSDEIRSVNLPDDAMIREKRDKDNKTGSASAYYESGKYIYKRSLDDLDATMTQIIEFEAVYQNAEVYLNGEKLAERPYGYSNFFVDVTGKLQPQGNELMVVADNEQVPNSRWYSGAGIYREVQVYTAGASYIKPEGLKVKVIDASSVEVTVDAVLAEGDFVKIDICDENQIVTSVDGKHATFKIPNAKVWSEETPYLYTCKAAIAHGGTTLDRAETRFGIRTLAWGKEGFLVNGKPILMRGACIHHDNGVIGACCFKDAEYRRVRLLKEAGFNAIRSAHNPMSKAMLDACDEMGMYVMDETFDMWMVKKNPYDYGKDKFSKWWRTDTESMISKDYNHPCVVMYSIGNEITDLGMEDGRKQAKVMVDFCHDLDNTRPVTAGINLMIASMAGGKNSIYGTDENGEVKDSGAGGLDSMPTSEFFNKMMNIMGTMMMVGSNTGKADKVAVKMRDIFDIPGYNYATKRYKKDASQRPDQATTGSETLPQSLYDNWQLVKSLPTMTGDFMWTGMDYLGEAGIGTVKYVTGKDKHPTDPGLIISGGAGIIDITGKMRPEVGWGKIIWGLQDQPTIGVDPVTHADDFQSVSMWRLTDAVESWSWEGYEGKQTMATVYSDADKVELFVNGKSYGKKKVKKDTAKFKKVTYEPGTIRVVAYDAAGKESGSAELCSACGKTSIQLTPETTELSANGQDLCFLNIDLVGENKITKASADQDIRVEVTGAGTLQGYGSARPYVEGSFDTDTFKTFYGKSLAVIRAGYEAGTIHVKVSGQGLETVELDLMVK